MLDFDKVKTASLFELAALFVCEFSRGVDALERIAPDATPEATVTPADTPASEAPCSHPVELRANRATMGREPFEVFWCPVCQREIDLKAKAA